MSTKDDGGPAYPNVPDGAGDTWADWDKGMTLRDYFAGQFLSTYVADVPPRAEQIAKVCYEMADAMLAERAKR